MMSAIVSEEIHDIIDSTRDMCLGAGSECSCCQVTEGQCKYLSSYCFKSWGQGYSTDIVSPNQVERGVNHGGRGVCSPRSLDCIAARSDIAWCHSIGYQLILLQTATSLVPRPPPAFFDCKQ